MPDFDFLPGLTHIRHRRLTECMVGADGWSTFETHYQAWRLLDGAGSVDRVWGTIGGSPFEGMSVRTYLPDSDEWIIYWADTGNTTLREQVRGSFEDGVGTFYGTEFYRGATYKMRFLWKDITASSARWEQAYQDPDSGDWETNWIMDFTTSNNRTR